MPPKQLIGALTRFTDAGEGTDPLRRNYGLHVNDDAQLVQERRRALAGEMGTDLIWMNQTHSTTVACVQRHGDRVSVHTGDSLNDMSPRIAEWDALDADAVVVDTRGWNDGRAPGACVMVADCMPILFSCPQGVIAAVHAGRVGLAGGILTATLNCYCDLGIPAEDIRGVVGPCVCGSCYEVPDSLRETVVASRPQAYAQTSWGTPALDLPAAAVAECASRGVILDAAGICTVENTLYHSYRRDARAGRQVGVIVRAS